MSAQTTQEHFLRSVRNSNLPSNDTKHCCTCKQRYSSEIIMPASSTVNVTQVHWSITSWTSSTAPRSRERYYRAALKLLLSTSQERHKTNLVYLLWAGNTQILKWRMVNGYALALLVTPCLRQGSYLESAQDLPSGIVETSSWVCQLYPVQHRHTTKQCTHAHVGSLSWLDSSLNH